MAYCLLWITHLAFSLLLVAETAALASRCETVFWRKFWPVLTAVLMFFTVAAAAGFGGYLLINNILPKWLFWYGLTQTIAYIIGAVIILKQGLKDVTSEAQTARSWPRVRLARDFGLVLFIYIVLLNVTETRILVHLADIRAEATGGIVNLMSPQFPDSLNSYPVYEAAFQSFGPEKDIPKWFQKSNKPDFNPASNEADRFLAAHQDVLKTVRRAATMPGYSPEVETVDFIRWPLPNYTKYRDLAKLLSLAARARTLAGDSTGAFQDLSVMEAMAGHLWSYPFFISFMGANRIDEIRHQSLEFILAHTPDVAPDLIGPPIKIHPSHPKRFRQSLRFEALGYLQSLGTVAAADDIHVFLNDSESGSAYGKVATKFWRIFMLPGEMRISKNVIAAGLNKPAGTYAELLKNLEEIEGTLMAGGTGMFTSVASPYSRLLVRSMRFDAIRGLCDLALAVTVYKASEGDYPDRLEDLVPNYIDKIPLDPYDLKPLKMKSVDGGMDFYSVGPGSNLKYGKEGKIHFYLGADPYEAYRVKPAREETRKKGKKRKK